MLSILNYLNNFYLNNFLYDITALFNNNFFNISYLSYVFMYFFLNISNFFYFLSVTFFSSNLFLKVKIIVINSNLIYGFNNVHPFILYFSAIIFFIKVFHLNNLTIFIKVKTLIMFYLLALVLGGV